MKLLIMLVITCAVVVSLVPVASGSPYAPIVHAGSDFVHQGYGHGGSGLHGSHHNSAHGGSHYDHNENHHRTTQVVESESSSSHNRGGSSFGRSSGGAHGAHNSYGHGHLTAGGRHQVVG